MIVLTMAQNALTCGNLKVGDYCGVEEDPCSKPIICSSDESTSSIGSASSSDSDMLDDASSLLSLSRLTYSTSDSVLCQGFSALMAADRTSKRGLSRYYEGKARTFTSLLDVKCVEDLAKKEILFLKRGHRTTCRFPMASILKKNTRASTNCLVSKSSDRPRIK